MWDSLRVLLFKKKLGSVCVRFADFKQNLGPTHVKSKYNATWNQGYFAWVSRPVGAFLKTNIGDTSSSCEYWLFFFQEHQRRFK